MTSSRSLSRSDAGIFPGEDDLEVVLPEAIGAPATVLARNADARLGLWIERHRDFLESLLTQYGAVAFRGLECPDRQTFVAVIERIGSQIMDIKEESSRRTHLGSSVYTATDHPSQYDIFPHHESSYSLSVPRRVFFHCVDQADDGGETLLADGCAIWSRIAPETRHKFDTLGWALHRRYGDGLGVGWQQAYATEDRREVEQHCLMADTQARWIESNLFTRQARSATLIHPVLRRPVWFNHICFFHRTAIPEDLLQLLLEEDRGLPFDTTYGNDEPIDAAVIEELRSAYRACTVSFKLLANDVLVLDNLRIAHGRRAFSGNRQLLFAAADPFGIPIAERISAEPRHRN
ncbi:MAG: TauD/TfdA family dioxygenase [Xanthobacteraceae bacterium]